MLVSAIIGAAIGGAYFAGFVRTSFMPLICALCFMAVQLLNGYGSVAGLCLQIIGLYIALMVCSRFLYRPHGTPVSIWSAMWMRDDEWANILSLNSTKIAMDDDDDDTDTLPLIQQHIYAIICSVTHLPTKDSLKSVISRVIPHYPQLRNIPQVGASMTQSSFTSVYDIKLEDHIIECRLARDKIGTELGEMMCSHQRMNLQQPWWDIYLVTPQVENNEMALDPQHAQLSVVVFRFHQAIIDLPTIRQFLADISHNYRSMAIPEMDGSAEADMSGLAMSEEAAEENKMAEEASEDSKIPLSSSGDRSRAKMRSRSGLLRGSSHALIDKDDLSSPIDEEIEAMNDASNDHNSWQRIRVAINRFTQWYRAATKMISVFCFNRYTNVFATAQRYAHTGDRNDSVLRVASERFDDSALLKIKRASSAKAHYIGRACIAGAVTRYFEDMYTDSDSLRLENGRILETHDLSLHETLTESSSSDGSRPIFNELIGLTSIPLAIGDDFVTARSRLTAITHLHDSFEEYQFSYIINQMFVVLANVLSDSLAKRAMSRFIRHHSLEYAYFPFNDDLFIGNQPTELLRVLKTNMNVPCLCMSTYNGEVSLDLTYCAPKLPNPHKLIQAFMAEMEDIDAMF